MPGDVGWRADTGRARRRITVDLLRRDRGTSAPGEDLANARPSAWLHGHKQGACPQDSTQITLICTVAALPQRRGRAAPNGGSSAFPARSATSERGDTGRSAAHPDSGPRPSASWSFSITTTVVPSSSSRPAIAPLRFAAQERAGNMSGVGRGSEGGGWIPAPGVSRYNQHVVDSHRLGSRTVNGRTLTAWDSGRRHRLRGRRSSRLAW